MSFLLVQSQELSADGKLILGLLIGMSIGQTLVYGASFLYEWWSNRREQRKWGKR